ncbi:hypothetical protein, partial [Microcoleus sp. D2_18a_D3]|uniref:hypothetical protein n=1 Tax=Microcoleus sp. D2_18a_D3 TaxID=3055330 RepID=UPI002FCEB77F
GLSSCTARNEPDFLKAPAFKRGVPYPFPADEPENLTQTCAGCTADATSRSGDSHCSTTCCLQRKKLTNY